MYASLAQTNPKKTAILILIVFGTAPGLGAAAMPNDISGKDIKNPWPQVTTSSSSTNMGSLTYNCSIKWIISRKRFDVYMQHA